MNMHRHFVIVLGGLVLLLIWSSVMLPTTSASAPAVGSKVAIPLLPVDGHWTGTTSRGYPMSFDVSSSGTAWSNFKLKTNFSVGGCSGTIETTVFGPGAITNNQFSYSGSTYSFSGQFTSPTTASGTYAYVNHSIPNCGLFSQSGTWTASSPPQSYTISGAVRDTNSIPIAGAQVIGFDSSGNPVITQTSADGQYTLNVNPDTYHIQACKQGYYCGHVFGVVVPPSHTGVDLILTLLDGTPTITPTATHTSTPTPGTPTTTPTPTPTQSSDQAKSYLPLVRKDASPTPTATPTVTPPGQFAVDGSWHGTTSLGTGITFTIVNREIAYIAVVACGGTFSVEYFLDRPRVVGNTFLVEETGAFGFTVRGTFTSDTTASGSVTLDNFFCTANATWSAMKQ